MTTLTNLTHSFPSTTLSRFVMVALLGLVPTVPIAAVNLALVAALVAALLRSRTWRWYLAIVALGVIVLMIDPTPFGIGQFRSSEGEPF